MNTTIVNKPKVERANFGKRMTVKTLKFLAANTFKEGSNPNRFTVSEISQKAGVSHETVHRLLLLHSRRLDLLGDVLADRLPLYKAIIKMRAEPEKWENRPRSRL